jgi:hypothetical protein
MVSTQVTTNSLRRGGNTALAVAGVARELRFAKGRCKNPGGPRDGSKQITIDLWNSSPVCSILSVRLLVTGFCVTADAVFVRLGIVLVSELN